MKADIAASDVSMVAWTTESALYTLNAFFEWPANASSDFRPTSILAWAPSTPTLFSASAAAVAISTALPACVTLASSSRFRLAAALARLRASRTSSVTSAPSPRASTLSA